MIIQMLFSFMRLHQIQNIKQTEKKYKKQKDKNLIFQNNREKMLSYINPYWIKQLTIRE